jgi:hypothetical protein
MGNRKTPILVTLLKEPEIAKIFIILCAQSKAQVSLHWQFVSDIANDI